MSVGGNVSCIMSKYNMWVVILILNMILAFIHAHLLEIQYGESLHFHRCTYHGHSGLLKGRTVYIELMSF